MLHVTPAHAAQLQYVSDLITDSRPATTTNHTLIFRATTAIPASGQITFAFEPALFSIAPSSSYSDADMAVSTSSPIAGFVDRSLAGTSDASNDGFALNATSGPIVITLNSSAGIGAGSYVRVKLGTNASFGGAGVFQIVNSATPASYRIRINTYNASAVALDYGAAMIAIVAPVNVGGNTFDFFSPAVSNAMPSGTLPGGITGVMLSFNTDEYAFCRYATSSMVYDSMTNLFDSTPSGLFHTETILGIVNNTTYNFYVRCVDFAGNRNATDTVISFATGNPLGTSQGSQGGAGSPPAGGGGGLFLPPSETKTTLMIQGRGLIGGKLAVLQDGVSMADNIVLDGTGAFSTTLTLAAQGNYSFTLNERDAAGKRISSYTTTITIVSKTQTAITGILMPPSIALDAKSVSPGGEARASGLSESSSTVEVWLMSSQTDSSGEGAIKKTVAADAKGVWIASLDTTGLGVDTYIVKARSSIPGYRVSSFSDPAYLGVGKAPVIPAATDINGDGKTNLIDFSILLFHWGKAYPPADFNHDGIVNLVDFSILLFNWTG
ncbi:MAG: hypothetical protein Q7S28_03315 [bacterium]|nr:hypothetical protein [bacterium]